MGAGPREYIVVDIETTGIDPTCHFITELGAVKIKDGQIIKEYSQLINPGVQISKQITDITGIDNTMVANAPIFTQVIDDFLDFIENHPIIGHNILFDFSFLKYHCQQAGYAFERYGIDTLAIAKKCLPDIQSRSLTYLIQYFNIQREKEHRAYHDALATYELYEIFKKRYVENKSELFIEKPLHWRPKKKMPITPKQQAYLSALIKKHKLFEELDVSQLSKSEASRYIDRIRFLKGC